MAIGAPQRPVPQCTLEVSSRYFTDVGGALMALWSLLTTKRYTAIYNYCLLLHCKHYKRSKAELLREVMLLAG